jgi:hypothetical protein
VRGILRQRELQVEYDKIAGGPEWCASCGGRVGVGVTTSFGDENDGKQFIRVACEDCGEQPATQ